MRIAITGHRPNKLDGDYNLTSPLTLAIKDKITSVLEEHFTTSANAEYEGLELITGMALGVDTLFAYIAIELSLPFIAAIPFKGQELRWPTNSQKDYHFMLTSAKEIVDVQAGITYGRNDYDKFYRAPLGVFSGAAMQARNIWMVDNSDLLIAVWDGSSGGTSNCVSYATIKGKQIIRIDPTLVKAELGVEK